MAQTAAEVAPATGASQPAPLRMTRTLRARREAVFAAWCSAEHVMRWFAPGDATVPHAKVEARNGGPFELAMRLPDGTEHLIQGVFREVAPGLRLVIDMRVTQGDGAPLFQALTELDFADTLGGTRLDILQTYAFADAAAAAPMVGGAREGWRATLDQLEAMLIRDQGGGSHETRSVVHATFNLVRTFEAPAVRVWAALTDSAAKAKWFGGPPGTWELIERHMDVRVGGTERLKGRWESTVTSCFDAIYHDVIPERRLVYSYVMHLNEQKISASLATLQLRAEGASTTLMVTEQGAFLDGYDDAGSREAGTALLLDALGASLKD
ncbi:MAG TPA: SRPBCC family protein [Caulobacteraceae bacterium]|nr:SRPBCC family protein [Caulobacteraceae bacterium]